MTDSLDIRNSSFGTPPVWAYLLQKPNPWGGDNRPLYKLYASASNVFSLSASIGERVGVRCRSRCHSPLHTRHSPLRRCPIQIDTSTPSCGNSRFGCWTCTVVERDKASEGLLASGDERMEKLIEFRETLLFYQDPANGKRDMKRKNGSDGVGRTSHKRAQSSQRTPCAVRSLAVRTFHIRHSAFCISAARQKGILMSDWKETNRLRELQEQIAAEKGSRGVD
ncbi:MAG: hypothetical protein HY674_01445 [Chloroflexi bacterium]|nr:hypothetical protein [Chloroflexota bacterium]